MDKKKISDHFTPAEVAQLDRELADIKMTYQVTVDEVRRYRAENPEMLDRGLLFAALVQQLSRIDKTRMVALLVEGLMRESSW